MSAEPSRGAPWIALSALALVASVVLGVSLGAEPIDLARALRDGSSLDRTILLELRLPHVALAAITGAGLSIVGAAYQALLKNPLAEPFVLGVSGGAAVGASIAIVLGLGVATTLGAALVPVAAFAGGLGATLLVYVVARNARAGTNGTSILLAGVMVNSVAAALVTLMKTFVGPSRAQLLLRWLTGFVELPTGAALAFVTLYVTGGTVILLADAARLNLLSLGNDSAETLGVDVRALSRRVFFASSCIVGALVSVTGLIGFVGLVVPHALRRLLGPDHRKLLPLSLVGGAIALVTCDVAARLSFRWLGTEPPVGAVTALVGGPLFLAFLSQSRRGTE